MSVSYFLGKTALTEFWDKTAEKIVFLGAWCLRYDREGDWQGLNHEILPHPWYDRRAMHQAARLEEELYEEMLPLLGEFLNEAHGEKHREQYWRIILGPWLLHYIQVLHERYLCLKLALERYPNIQTMGLADSSFRIPRFFWDHLHGCTDDPYNLQLYTVILKAMGYPPPTREYNWGWEDSTPSMPGSSGPLWKRLGRRLKPLWRQCESLWGKRAPILLVDM